MAFNLIELDPEAYRKQLQAAPLSQIADIIRREWRPIYFAAQPYVAAMLQCPSVDSHYGVETGKDIVLRFLCNCATWRGPVARLVKAELQRRVRS